MLRSHLEPECCAFWLRLDSLRGRLPLAQFQASGDTATDAFAGEGEPVTDGGIQGAGEAAPVVADSSIEASAYFELGKA